MRIGFFSDSYFPEIDGVAYTLKNWKERLEQRGHEVFIVYPESENYDSERNEIPVKSVSNPFYPGYGIPVPTGFDKFPDDLDVVHCHTPAFLGLAGKIYAERNGIPSVYTHHTPLEEYFVQVLKSEKFSNILGGFYVSGEEWVLSRFDKLISNTDEGRRNLEMDKLAAGVDMEFFKPVEGIWDFDKPVIGYSGRISNEKNIEEVLEMVTEIDAKTIVVGEGPVKEKLKRQASDEVIFKDFLDREKLPSYYSMLDVFVTASTGDTLGLSSLEANACGTPVVAPDLHPFDKTIEDGSNGYLYSKGDVNDFRRKVEKALKKDWSTRKAVEKYSLSKSIDKVEEIYREVA